MVEPGELHDLHIPADVRPHPAVPGVLEGGPLHYERNRHLELDEYTPPGREIDKAPVDRIRFFGRSESGKGVVALDGGQVRVHPLHPVRRPGVKRRDIGPLAVRRFADGDCPPPLLPQLDRTEYHILRHPPHRLLGSFSLSRSHMLVV